MDIEQDNARLIARAKRILKAKRAIDFYTGTIILVGAVARGPQESPISGLYLHTDIGVCHVQSLREA